MKSFKDYFKIVLEEKKPKSTTKTKPVIDLGPDLEPSTNQPITPYTEPNREPRDSQGVNVPNMPRASQNDTLHRTQNIFNPDMADLLSRMRDIEVDPEDPGYPEEPTTDITTRVTTDNLPSVASANIQQSGMQSPEWHKVANLPGNMQRAIRTLGRKLFGSMTDTPTEDVYMIGNLGNRGPNTHQEVNAVINWIQEHGQDLGPGNIDFDNVIPGYTADIHQYTAGGIRWLLVQDQFGDYIYSWPESDSKDISNTNNLPSNRRSLPSR